MDYNAELCLERHKQNEKEHVEFAGDINCLHKKKADRTEVDNLKEWTSKLDARMWAAVVTALVSAVSAVSALAAILLKQ